VFPHRRDYITKIGLRTEDGELISDQINMIVIELSKLGEILKKPIDKMTSLDMWSVFLGHANNPDYRGIINEMIERKEVLGMAGAVLTAISKDEDERAKFLSRRKAETDRISNLLTAEERGRVMGQRQVARNLKAMGMSNIDIVQATGLSINEINNL
jgi:predicted transposase/invertase (TIGR01784 family)